MGATMRLRDFPCQAPNDNGQIGQMANLTAHARFVFFRGWLRAWPQEVRFLRHRWKFGWARVAWIGLRVAWFVLRDLFGVYDRSLWLRRQRACRRCGLWNARLKTCGTLVADGPQTGCLCYMPIKSLDAGANCWLYERGIEGVGWPRELNGDEL